MRPMIQMPDVKASSYAIKGSLDLSTQAILIDPGVCFDAQNYEPSVSGGASRVMGFEACNGTAAPSSASYWLISATAIVGALTVGATLTGFTSGATGVILGVFGSTIVLGRKSGTYQAAEALRISGATVATSTSTEMLNAASRPSDHADYRLLAANDRRTFITAVPGSGPIRGVWVYEDVLYAFRDNAGGTAGSMWKATSSGWVQITLGTEIQFSSAIGQIFAGNTVTGLTSGATAVVSRALLRTGTWTVSGIGTLVITTPGTPFINGESLQVGGVTKATSSSASTAIARQPGGRVECVNENFTGSTLTKRMYGVDGVNLAFEFDGTTYVPIRTGMVTDAPTHVVGHKNYLMLSFFGSLQISSIGNPYAWTAVTGAAEITTGSQISGLLPISGGNGTSSLAVPTAEKMFVLYGASGGSFQLVPSVDDLGYLPYTMQSVGNNTYGLTARGIQSLVSTLNYGNFAYTAISFLVDRLIDQKRGKQTASTTLRDKNQYRLYFDDNTAVVVGLTGDKPSGILPLNYGLVVRCITTATLSTGEEVTYFGSDDGFVYQENKGTSFNGLPIPAWIRPAFNNLQSPLVRKTYRRAVFEVKSNGYSQVNISYDLGYATPGVSPPGIQQDVQLNGSGAYWSQGNWDQFTWSAPVVETASIIINGTEKNISFVFYSNRAQDDPHTVQSVSLLYTPRRLERA